MGFNISSIAQLIWKSHQVQSQLQALCKADKGMMLKIKHQHAELVRVTQNIEDLITHHWWDIFSG